MTEAPPPKLLNATQVAAKLEVSPETVTDWANKGKIDYIELPSGRFRYRQETVDEILAGRKAAAS
jgi:predicted site-specific integrase-resolvase